MTIRELIIAGMPQTVPPATRPFRPRAIAGHWTAGGPGIAGAEGSARFLAGVTARNASYHEVWAWEGGELHIIVLVRGDRYAHSMNPGQPPNGPWEPNAHVRQLLGDRWWDPNSVSYAVSFAGMPADLAAAMKDPRFVPQAAARIRQLRDRYPSLPDEDLIFRHGEGQPSTRYDWGTALTPAIYAAWAGGSSEDDDMLPTRRKAQVWQALEDLPVHQSPGSGSPVIATIARGAYFPSIQEQAELVAGAWRTVGPWRTVVLADDRTGYIARTSTNTKPVPEGAAAFDRLNRGTLYEVDTAAVPAWPLAAAGGISQAQLEEAVKVTRSGTIAEARTVTARALDQLE